MFKESLESVPSPAKEDLYQGADLSEKEVRVLQELNPDNDAKVARVQIEAMREGVEAEATEKLYAESGLPEDVLQRLKAVNPRNKLVQARAQIDAYKDRFGDRPRFKPALPVDEMSDLDPAELGKKMASKMTKTFSPMARFKMWAKKTFKG